MSFLNFRKKKKKEQIDQEIVDNNYFTIDNDLVQSKTLIKFKNRTNDVHWYYGEDTYDERYILEEYDKNIINLDIENDYLIYQWLVKEGDYVNKGEALFLIRYLPYKNAHGYKRVSLLPPFFSPISGKISIDKFEDEALQDEQVICRISVSEKPQNLFSNKKYLHYFNKYEIPIDIRDIDNIQKKYNDYIYSHEIDKIYILEWLIENEEFVESGAPMLKVGAIHNNTILYEHIVKSKQSGIVYKVLDIEKSSELYQYSLLCIVFEDKLSLYEYLYFNKPNLVKNEFNNEKILKWSFVGGFSLLNNTYPEQNYGCIKMNSLNNNSDLYFSLENYSSKDYIVFSFYKNQYSLSLGDIIQFKFDDESIINFKIEEKPYNLYEFDRSFYQTKIIITINEIKKILNTDLIKWNVQFLNGDNFQFGNFVNNQLNPDLFAIILKTFIREYIELVNEEIQNYTPILERKLNDAYESTKNNNDKCSVYLMQDISNNFYKIGISNKPKYREKTLQSEKPTIELICSKVYPDRIFATNIEKALHNSFIDKRIRGEWFDLSIDDIRKLKEMLND